MKTVKCKYLKIGVIIFIILVRTVNNSLCQNIHDDFVGIWHTIKINELEIGDTLRLQFGEIDSMETCYFQMHLYPNASATVESGYFLNETGDCSIENVEFDINWHFYIENQLLIIGERKFKVLNVKMEQQLNLIHVE
ncbi:MAG: hypothetical protein JEZ09_04480 [Salinivirgaceae bacterium]|nr:hypothetical protein [Salinivirgaceae bacterium]